MDITRSAPDVIVAIDLGMTYTGVGWARPQPGSALQTPIQAVHNWPGSLTLSEQKVKTCLAYAPDGHLSSWGYLCDEDHAPGLLRREFFKIFIDQATVDKARREGLAGAPASTLEAQRLISDFLRQVYRHIRETLELQIGVGTDGARDGARAWSDLAIEFLFSVPTTWRTHSVINAFKNAIRDAGFGADGPRHSAAVDLTESEAAAVATIKSASIHFHKDDFFIVVDAGGGTTDCAVMHVLDAGRPFPKLAQVAEVDGVGIGSTLIDLAFAAIVRQRIHAFPDLVELLPPDCVDSIVRSEAFRRMKHRFGASTAAADVHGLPIEGVSFSFNYPAAGIEGGRLLFKSDEIQKLFDPHIEKILGKVREQLDWADVNLSGRKVSYMVLSGGLGSSQYVRDRLAESLKTKPHNAAPVIQILQAPDPQLVIVRGTLLDRMQRLDSGRFPVLVQRRARSSYGVVSEQVFDPAVHADCPLRTDPYDGKIYAVEQISWLLRKGDVVSIDRPISRAYFRYLPHINELPSWDSIIVQSHSDRDKLPRNMAHGDAKRICVVTSNLKGITPYQLQERRKPNESWHKRGEKYYICSYHVRAIIGSTDLRFELWIQGRKFSGNHEPIKVEWEDSIEDTKDAGEGRA